MPRNVTVLFDSRAEAESARLRLASEVGIRSTRLLSKETAAAVDNLKLNTNLAKQYREALFRGDHLLVAELAGNEQPARIIELLEQTGDPVPAVQPQQSYQVSPAEDEEADADDVRVVDETPVHEDIAPATVPATAAHKPAAAEPERIRQPIPAASAAREPAAGAPQPAGERMGDRDEVREIGTGTARLRSRTREMEAEEQVALATRRVDIAHQAAERRVTPEEAAAAGLLRERTLEFIETREEPIVSKEIMVREEVIVRKTINERTETIRDTVRRTEVEVEELR